MKKYCYRYLLKTVDILNLYNIQIGSLHTMKFAQGFNNQKPQIKFTINNNCQPPQNNLARTSNKNIRSEAHINWNPNQNNNINKSRNFCLNNEVKPNMSIQTLADSNNNTQFEIARINGGNQRDRAITTFTHNNNNKFLSDSIIGELSQQRLGEQNMNKGNYAPIYNQGIQETIQNSKSIRMSYDENFPKLPIKLKEQNQSMAYSDFNKQSRSLWNLSASQNNNTNQNGRTQTYEELQAENQKLSALIKNEYEPIRKSYDKLVKEQEDRDYLISQLEWKVKNLAKELKTKKRI